MRLEVGLHALIGVEQRVDHVGPHAVLHPGRRRRDESLDVEVVRVDEEPHQRHLVVGLVGDVGHDDHPRAGRVRVYTRRRGDFCRLARQRVPPALQRAISATEPMNL